MRAWRPEPGLAGTVALLAVLAALVLALWLTARGYAGVPPPF